MNQFIILLIKQMPDYSLHRVESLNFRSLAKKDFNAAVLNAAPVAPRVE